MNLKDILREIALKNPEPLDETNDRILREIKTYADANFSDQLFYGNAALNRQMLLDPYIAERLTPSVIRYTLTHDAEEEHQLLRGDGTISLSEAIVFGLSDGLNVVKYMPNNEADYNSSRYSEQNILFQNNTLKILKNIRLALNDGQEGQEADEVLWRQFIAEQEKLPLGSLSDNFEEIAQRILTLKRENRSNDLLYVPKYTPDQIREQVSDGFIALCSCMGINNLAFPITIPEETLESFCDRCMKHPEALLNGYVIHLFYDRVHMEAALEQETVIGFSDGKHTYYDILKQMITLLDKTPEQYPPFVQEQFRVRLLLVTRDLNSNRLIQTLDLDNLEEKLEPQDAMIRKQEDEAAANPVSVEDNELRKMKDSIICLLDSLYPNSLPAIQISTQQALSILSIYANKFRLQHNSLSANIEQLIIDVQKAPIEKFRLLDITGGLAVLMLPISTSKDFDIALHRIDLALLDLAEKNDDSVELIKLVKSIRSKILILHNDRIREQNYGQILKNMRIESKKIKESLVPLIEKHPPQKSIKYQVDEALIKQTLWLLLNKLQSSSAVASIEKQQQPDFSSEESEYRGKESDAASPFVSLTTPSLKTIKTFLTNGRLDDLCRYLQSVDEKLLTILEEEISSSTDEIITEEQIPRKITLAAYYKEQKEKRMTETGSALFEDVFQGMYEENKSYFNGVIADFIRRPFMPMPPINAADPRVNPDYVSYETIQYILKHGQISLVCKHLDEHFLMALENTIQNSSVEFCVVLDDQTTKVKIADWYLQAKSRLQSKLNQAGILNEPPFGDILQAMYTTDGAYYQKLNAVLKNQSHFGAILPAETELGFLLQAGQHKGGLDKARGEMQKIPSTLFRGDTFLGNAAMVEEIQKKYQLFNRLKNFGFLSLDTKELALLNLTGLFDKKMLSTTEEISSTEIFVDKGIIFHIENASDMADFYSVANVSMGGADEREFISLLKENIVLIPIQSYEKSGRTHVKLFAVPTDAFLNTPSLFAQRLDGLIKLITVVTDDDPLAGIDAPLIERLRVRKLKEKIETLAQHPDLFLSLESQDAIINDMIKLMTPEVILSDRKGYYDKIKEEVSLILAILSEFKLLHNGTTPKKITSLELKNSLYRLEMWLASLNEDKDSAAAATTTADRLSKLPPILQPYFKVILSTQEAISPEEKNAAVRAVCLELSKESRLSDMFPQLTTTMQHISSLLERMISKKPSQDPTPTADEEKQEMPEAVSASPHQFFASSKQSTKMEEGSIMLPKKTLSDP